MTHGLLTIIGALLITLTAVTGWFLEYAYRYQEQLAKIGIIRIRSLLQMHLDWVMMGLIMIAVDTILPERPTWVTALIAFGLVMNTLLFLPLAWGDVVRSKKSYLIVSFFSYLASSVGMIAVFALLIRP